MKSVIERLERVIEILRNRRDLMDVEYREDVCRAIKKTQKLVADLDAVPSAVLRLVSGDRVFEDVKATLQTAPVVPTAQRLEQQQPPTSPTPQPLSLVSQPPVLHPPPPVPQPPPPVQPPPSPDLKIEGQAGRGFRTAALVKLLSDGQPRSIDQIAVALGITKGNAQQIACKARRSGKIGQVVEFGPYRSLEPKPSIIPELMITEPSPVAHEPKPSIVPESVIVAPPPPKVTPPKVTPPKVLICKRCEAQVPEAEITQHLRQEHNTPLPPRQARMFFRCEGEPLSPLASRNSKS